MSYLYDVTTRFWDDLVSRPSGPLAFRFVLQLVVASLYAIRDGYHDAHDGRMPYFWTILHDRARRRARLKEGIRAVERVVILGIAMDALYQFMVLKAFRPLEMIIVVFFLCFVPYLLVRGPAKRLTHRWNRGSSDRRKVIHG